MHSVMMGQVMLSHGSKWLQWCINSCQSQGDRAKPFTKSGSVLIYVEGGGVPGTMEECVKTSRLYYGPR